MTTFTYDDLIAWSERLPLWQRDALRRVLSGNLTDADILDLAEMAKANQGMRELRHHERHIPAFAEVVFDGKALNRR